MPKRKIIKIDEDKCNGCGLCIPNCHEGALQVIDGKARLISDALCDGLGACLGHCPQDAIIVEEREAEEYNDHAHGPSGCPGSRVMEFRRNEEAPLRQGPGAHNVSRLQQWPVQIMLVSTHAPYFKGADLLIAADCVPFAYADFHEELLKGRILLVGCPKLDDIAAYKEKIDEIVKHNSIRSITCAHMEVPCCFGLIEVIRAAIAASGKNIPFHDVTIAITGQKRS